VGPVERRVSQGLRDHLDHWDLPGQLGQQDNPESLRVLARLGLRDQLGRWDHKDFQDHLDLRV